MFLSFWRPMSSCEPCPLTREQSREVLKAELAIAGHSEHDFRVSLIGDAGVTRW